jgi:hypothetical protein
MGWDGWYRGLENKIVATQYLSLGGWRSKHQGVHWPFHPSLSRPCTSIVVLCMDVLCQPKPGQSHLRARGCVDVTKENKEKK